MWVVAERALAYVYAAGARNVASGTLGDIPGGPVMFSAVRVCVRLTVPTDTPGFAEAVVVSDDCTPYIDIVLPAHHTNVCVATEDAACATIMVRAVSLSACVAGRVCHRSDLTQPFAQQLPLRDRGDVRVVTFDAVAGTHATRVVPALTRRGRALATALALDDRLPLYLTHSGDLARSQRHISSTAFTTVATAVVFVAGAGQQAWIQNVRVAVDDAGEYTGLKSLSAPVVHTVTVTVNCSTDNCIGCLPNVRKGGPPSAELLTLQNKCMAAQQCAVARCVGTTVNMRKPLCNIGKVSTVPLPAFALAPHACVAETTRPHRSSPAPSTPCASAPAACGSDSRARSSSSSSSARGAATSTRLTRTRRSSTPPCATSRTPSSRPSPP